MKKVLVLGLVLLGACGSEPETAPVVASDFGTRGLKELQTASTVTVQGLPEDYAQGDFEVVARTTDISQYPCATCHRDPLPAPTPDGQVVAPRSMHLEIPAAHAGASVMDCRSCHDATDLGVLRLNDGTSVGFDHAYRVCAQCHFEQGRDWIGGAHGKRLAAWTGTRVILSCPACHNPHAPRIESRWPVTYPRIPRTEVSP